MIKTLKTMSKQDKERYTVPRKVQDVIPVRRIWQDGIFLTGNKFSKTYQFSDINYLVASREDKESMFLIYSELLNSLDSGAVTKITINNRRTNKANFENSILMPMQEDLFYVKLRIPSMIVTTGLALIYESVANYIAGGVEQTLPSNLRAFGQMPGDIILALVACAVAYIFLNYTKIGTYTYAIGSDEFVAKNMGINVNKYKVLAFILSGAFLGVMAILTISYGSSMVAVTGMASMSRNFIPTMGCFFGLAFKKYGMPLPAIIIGEFVINIIFFGFIALGAPTAIQDVITGLALLIIITVTTKATKGEIVK